jgi:hypothetical protein
MLEPLVTIKGTVIDEENNPVAGVLVTIGEQNDRTDIKGKYIIQNVPGGVKVIVAKKESLLYRGTISLKKSDKILSRDIIITSTIPTPTPTPSPTPTLTPKPIPPIAYKVLFDETKLIERSEGGYECQISETAWYGCWNFSKLLEGNGFSVSSISTRPITYKKLKEYDVLIIFSFRDYSEDEIDAIEKFVEEGGGLFLPIDTWRGKEEYATKKIAKRFRVSFAKEGEICDPTNYYSVSLKNVIEIFDIKPHAITVGIYSFYLVSGTYIIHTGSSNVLAYADSDAWFDDLWDEQEDGTMGNMQKDADEITGPFPVLSVMDYGEGRIVFMGAKGLFMNGWLDKLDNEELGLNIVKWLGKKL